jgi:hypothetical protein
MVETDLRMASFIAFKVEVTLTSERMDEEAMSCAISVIGISYRTQPRTESSCAMQYHEL